MTEINPIPNIQKYSHGELSDGYPRSITTEQFWFHKFLETHCHGLDLESVKIALKEKYPEFYI